MLESLLRHGRDNPYGRSPNRPARLARRDATTQKSLFQCASPWVDLSQYRPAPLAFRSQALSSAADKKRLADYAASRSPYLSDLATPNEVNGRDRGRMRAAEV